MHRAVKPLAVIIIVLLYIISHAYDRKGTYDWVGANKPA
jgi:hypothetical protein